jgi:hypothetical protein
MTKDYDTIIAKYPKLFRQKDLPMNKTCMCWGICCGIGWYDLIDEVCQKLSEHPIEFTQVKEKWGGLRMYYQSIDGADVNWEAVELIISQAEMRSVETCDQCGDPGTIGGKGWISCRCEKHR